MSHGGVDKQSATVKICLACNREFQGQVSTCPHDGTALIALKHEDEFIGSTLSNTYHVTEKIGQGGMGVVYKANHQMLDRIVAIKMLQAELTQDELSVKRFQQEAKAASCLSHPHIITLFDFGILPTGQPFLVMEYLEGVPLLDEIKLRGPLDPLRATKIFSEVADGLYHAHKQGIVHRDIKPSNIILVDKDADRDFVKVVDFGLAKLMPWSGKESQHLTKTGEVFGSPIYMSPEQCMGKKLQETSDIYSLGITLYEALTGKPPFRGSNSIKTASMHMTDPPPRFSEINPAVSLPDALERVVLKTLAKEPEHRFQNMAEFKDALQAAVFNDVAIDIPPSLLVSRQAIPSLSSSGSVPSIKSSAGLSSIRNSAIRPAVADQSETRAIGFVDHSKKKATSTLILVPIAIALLGVFFAVYYFYFGPGATKSLTVDGNIWYYDPQTVDLHKGDTVYTLTLDDNTKYTNGPLGKSLDNSDVGKLASVKYTTRPNTPTVGLITEISLQKNDETPETKACTIVNNLLTTVTGSQPDYAITGLTKLPLEKIKQIFPPNLIPVHRVVPKESSFAPSVEVKPPGCQRIVSDGTTGIAVEVDKSQYVADGTNNDSRYWKFIIEDGVITDISESSE